MNYFFDDMINIKNFDSNLLKIGNKLYKKIYIYYIGYIIKNRWLRKNLQCKSFVSDNW